MSSKMLAENAGTPSQPTRTRAVPEGELGERARKHVKRVRRLKINAAAWALGTILFTALWVLNQWQANGAFERIANEGNPGDWNPTLWALGVGLWGLVVGFMALRVNFQRPRTEAQVDRELERLGPRIAAEDAPAHTELRRFTRTRLERIQRLKFHMAAWVLGMIVLTPLWVLIEWQDNGGFERWSDNSRPGDWEPWILYVGGVWALVISGFALYVCRKRPTRGEIEGLQ